MHAGRSLPISINVYMTLNVLTPGNVYAGDITDANIAQQMSVMNAAFAGAGVRLNPSTCTDL